MRRAVIPASVPELTQADFFGDWNRRADTLGQFDFQLGRRAVGKSALRLIGNRRDYRRMRVARVSQGRTNQRSR